MSTVLLTGSSLHGEVNNHYIPSLIHKLTKGRKSIILLYLRLCMSTMINIHVSAFCVHSIVLLQVHLYMERSVAIEPRSLYSQYNLQTSNRHKTEHASVCEHICACMYIHIFAYNEVLHALLAHALYTEA